MRLRRSRDTVDGRFVTAAVAAAHPATTVTETSRPASRLAAYANALCEALAENGDLELISIPSHAAYEVVMALLHTQPLSLPARDPERGYGG